MSATPELGSRKSHFLVTWTSGTRREEDTVLPCRRSAVLVLDWIVLCPTVEALVSRMKGLKMCHRQILSSVVVLSHEFGICYRYCKLKFGNAVENVLRVSPF